MDKQWGVEASAKPESDSTVVRRASWKDYVTLTKPGILRSNVIAAFAGFWLASQWNIEWVTLFYMLIGTTFIMASSTVLNNYLDRDMDRKMERTKKRALPTGLLTPAQVLWFGIILGMIGLAVLFFLEPLTALLGLIGFIVYVGIYTAWLKPTSTLSTVMGSFSGSMPPVIGYCSVSGKMDMGAWILFAILFLWQPPHFWALGIRRVEEYRAAGFKILPVVKGILRTKIQMLPYVVLLIPVSVLLYTYEYVGVFYLFAAVVFGLLWLGLCIAGFWAKDDDAWARRTFLFSINYLMITFIIMMVDTTRG